LAITGGVWFEEYFEGFGWCTVNVLSADGEHAELFYPSDSSKETIALSEFTDGTMQWRALPFMVAHVQNERAADVTECTAEYIENGIIPPANAVDEGAHGSRVWCGVYTSVDSQPGSNNYYPGCNKGGCDPGSGLCRCFVSFSSNSAYLIPKYPVYITSKATITHGTFFERDGVTAAVNLLKCIASDRQPLFRLLEIGVTGYIRSAEAHPAEFWRKITKKAGNVDRQRFIPDSARTGPVYAHSVPYEVYLAHAPIHTAASVDSAKVYLELEPSQDWTAWDNFVQCLSTADAPVTMLQEDRELWALSAIIQYITRAGRYPSAPTYVQLYANSAANSPLTGVTTALQQQRLVFRGIYNPWPHVHLLRDNIADPLLLSGVSPAVDTIYGRMAFTGQMARH
jgi:hypothetical protein